ESEEPQQSQEPHALNALGNRTAVHAVRSSSGRMAGVSSSGYKMLDESFKIRWQGSTARSGAGGSRESLVALVGEAAHLVARPPLQCLCRSCAAFRFRRRSKCLLPPNPFREVQLHAAPCAPDATACRRWTTFPPACCALAPSFAPGTSCPGVFFRTPPS
ncbi:unnamed protein product, partial [Prorocentrum cordatum]